MIRKASAVWNGTGKEGKGSLSSTSGVLNNTPYSFITRFVSEDGKAGTNPEELIAAAHAACFNMALSFQLTGAGFSPEELKCQAHLTMELVNGHFEIKSIHLELTAKVSGITTESFEEIVENVKHTCPVSRALKAISITTSTTLH